MAITIPLEILLIIGTSIDLLLAYLGFNIFKSIKKRLLRPKPKYPVRVR
jgi:hypothetical protein